MVRICHLRISVSTFFTHLFCKQQKHFASCAYGETEMITIKINKSPGVKEILNRTFPEYKGRKFKLTNYIPSQLNSYWDGGTRHEYVFYNLATKQSHHVATNHPFFESSNPRDTPADLPKNVIIVEHHLFCGKDLGITFHVNIPDEEIPKMLNA